MSETNNVPTVTVPRNGVEAPLSYREILKGKRKGFKYLAPKVEFDTEEKWKNWQTWLSVKDIANIVQSFLNRTFQDIFLSNGEKDEKGTYTGRYPGFNEDGTPDVLMLKFLKEAPDFSAAGQKLAELLDLYEEAQAAFGQRVNNATDSDMDNAEWRAKTKEANSYILVLKQQIDDRRRKRTSEEDEGKAEPSVAVS